MPAFHTAKRVALASALPTALKYLCVISTLTPDLKDAIAAYAFAQTKGFPIVIWGRSLGSGPATYVASEREAETRIEAGWEPSACASVSGRPPCAPTPGSRKIASGISSRIRGR